MVLIAAPVCGQGSAQSGLKAEITGVTIPANRRPVVTFNVSDAKGQPLEINDLDANSVKFTIAALKAEKNGERGYSNYILSKVAGKEYVFKDETRKPRLLTRSSRAPTKAAY